MSANNGVSFYANNQRCAHVSWIRVNSKMLHYYGKFHRHNSVPA